MKRPGRFKYHKRSVDSFEKRANQSAYGDRISIFVDGVKTFTPHDAKNKIRFLPPTWPRADHFGMDIFVHYGVGPNEATFLCPKEMKTADWCPLCDEAKKASEADDKEYAKKLYAKKRVLAYVLDRDAEQDSVPLVWSMPFSIDRDFGKLAYDPETKEAIPIDDNEEGFDVYFHKEGKGVNTKYTAPSISRKSSPLGSDEALEYAVKHPLTEILNHVTPEEIKEQFLGGVKKKKKSRDEDDDDDVRGKRKSRGEEEDEDDDDDGSSRKKRHIRDEEDEEDDDIRSSNRSRPGRRTRDEDEETEDGDDEDSDDGEEDEDDTPRRRGKKRPRDEDEEEEEDEADLTWRDLKAMGFKALSRLVTKEDLEIDLDLFDEDEEDDVQKLRKKIARQMDVELPDVAAAKLARERK